MSQYFKHNIVITEYADTNAVTEYLTTKYKAYSFSATDHINTLAFTIGEGILEVHINKNLGSVYLKLINLPFDIVRDIPKDYIHAQSCLKEYYKAKFDFKLNVKRISCTFLSPYGYVRGESFGRGCVRDFVSFGNVITQESWTFEFETKKQIEWSRATHKFFEQKTKDIIKTFLLIAKRFKVVKDITFLIISKIAKLSQPAETKQKVRIYKNKVKVTGQSINFVLSNIILDYVTKNCVDVL